MGDTLTCAIPEVTGRHGAHDLNTSSGATDRNIEATMPAPLRERAHLQRELAVLIRSVADAEDDDVSLIALDVLKILDEEAVKAVIGQVGRQVLVLGLQLVDFDLDGRGLCLGEGDDAEAALGVVARVEQHSFGHLGRFDWVVARTAAPVDALDLD